jgi:hypothetical protein
MDQIYDKYTGTGAANMGMRFLGVASVMKKGLLNLKIFRTADNGIVDRLPEL